MWVPSAALALVLRVSPSATPRNLISRQLGFVESLRGCVLLSGFFICSSLRGMAFTRTWPSHPEATFLTLADRLYLAAANQDVAQHVFGLRVLSLQSLPSRHSIFALKLRALYILLLSTLPLCVFSCFPPLPFEDVLAKETYG